MASNAFWAYGSILQLGDGATSEVFTAIAELTELTPPQMSRDDIDVTSHQSPDGHREFIPGMRDGGEVSAKANWLPTNATHDETTGLLSSFNNDDVHNWRLYIPVIGKTLPFRGFLTAFEPDLPIEEQAQLSFTIKVSGKPGALF
ncbi:MAG TPA: outer capsid protein Hoc [Nitrospiraceae bacterium]|nr:outer capsid protein Hoc [Nitrospiraceae bacterium]